MAGFDLTTEAIVVAVSDQPDRYLVIDGYKRIAALEQLGRDTVEAVKQIKYNLHNELGPAMKRVHWRHES